MSLLGGLLGGLGGGGGLRSMLGRKGGGGGGGGGFTSAPAVDRSQPMAPEAEEQPQQTSPQKRQPEPEKQPDEPQAAEQVATKIAEPVVQKQAEQESPIKGLLDAPPASQPADSSGTAEQTPAAPSVVNNSEEMTPVTRPADEIAGSTPTLFKTDGVLNQLMDSGGNRQPTEFQEGMPARTPSIEDRSYQFKGPTSVAGALPARRYRSRV